eukprot:GHVT01097111.1.p1 GENE.GHVT01097111.1~~GHVT01097111.1.p1  ORF type:complete len:201 (-),score=39.46 GHVT01097111.1:638-1240(-)
MAATAATAARGWPKIGEAFFLCCDLQERFRSKIHRMPRVIHTAARMLEASRLLEMPTLISEQYPKALGTTVCELSKFLPAPGVSLSSLPLGDSRRLCHRYAKVAFSMCADEGAREIRRLLPTRRTAVIYGIEAHICVLQTILDLRALGFEVHVLVDGVSSQRLEDCDVALRVSGLTFGKGHAATGNRKLLLLCRGSREHP